MSKRQLGICILLAVLVSMSVFGQEETTPEPTPLEATAESTAPAEDICPELVEQAIDITQVRCDAANRNQVCYGHSLIDAELRPGNTSNLFSAEGDIVDVIEIESIILSAMDEIAGIWGVGLMEIQANLEQVEDVVTFIVFGDTALTNFTFAELTATTAANVREQPSIEAAVIEAVQPGETYVANGRTADGDWLRVRLTQEEGQIDPEQIGWIFAELVEVEGEIESLRVIPTAGEQIQQEVPPATFGPMQAFYFESGRDDAPCTAAPDSGMLIQTPEGEASMSIWIDEVVIELSATAFVQADSGGDLTVNVLEGLAEVTANGETRTAVAGSQISVPLNEALGATDAPNAPQPIDPDDLNALPVELLDNPVDIADPIDLGPGVPVPGSWSFTWLENEPTCPDGEIVRFETTGALGTVSIADDGATLNWGGPYSRTGTGVYERTYVDGQGNLHQDVLTVEALDRISGQKTVDFVDKVCTLTVPFRLQLVAPN